MTDNRRISLSTHVLDTSVGAPARGVAVILERVDDAGIAEPIGGGTTDQDGRLRDLAGGAGGFEPGVYRLRFATGAYFAGLGRETFFPEVTIEFSMRGAAEHYHVPLLVSPFGYSTYRGS